jgi:hypothetical protein
MRNDEINPNDEVRMGMTCFQRAVMDSLGNCIGQVFIIRASSFLRHSAFVMRH